MKVSAGRAAAAGLAWTAGTAAAAAVGVLALSLIGDALVDRSLPPARTALLTSPTAAATSTAAGPSPSLRPSPSIRTGSSSLAASRSSAPDRVLISPAGSVVAHCTAEDAYLVSWSPAQGYRVDDVFRGPADVVRVIFERQDWHELMTVRCIGGTPQASTRWVGDR